MAATMSSLVQASPKDWTFADVQDRLGGIPAERIRTYPAPGTATEEDVIRVQAQTDRICELVDGILVEKVMSSFESRLAVTLIYFLESYLEHHDLGVVLGGDGQLKLFPKQVRVPDVSFLRWERFPNRAFPQEAIWSIAPDLAVEILSPGNTKAEMDRKVREYFQAGARRVWLVDPLSRTAQVYTSPRRFTVINEDGLLDAGNLLPGFELRLKDWFNRCRAGCRAARKTTAGPPPRADVPMGLIRTRKVIPSDPAWEATKATRRNLTHHGAVQEAFFLQKRFHDLGGHHVPFTLVDLNLILWTLVQKKIPFVLTGAHGIAGWTGRPRATRDVDLLVKGGRNHARAVKAIRVLYPDLEGPFDQPRGNLKKAPCLRLGGEHPLHSFPQIAIVTTRLVQVSGAFGRRSLFQGCKENRFQGRWSAHIRSLPAATANPQG